MFFFSTPDLGYYSIPSTFYLAPQVTGININEPWALLSDKPSILSDPAIFVFPLERESEIKAVQNNYPNGTLIAEQAWNHNVLFWLYEIHKNP